MKLTLQLQLLPDDTQADALRAIVERFNEAATWLAGVACTRQCTNKVVLQQLTYYELRERFGLPVDTAIRCIAQVVEASKRDKTCCPTFRPHAAVPFSMRKNISFRESGFRRDTNHCISKTLVAAATGTHCGLALEDLQDLRSRTQFRQPQRARMSGWAFAQLRFFVEYKAKLAGVPVVVVDPRHTSQACSLCGHIAKANRQSQAQFSCKKCGYTTHADFNAAQNIRHRARVNVPQVAGRRPQ